MAGRYAAQTDVPVSRSRDEIERTLTRFGATAFAYMSASDGKVAVQFEIEGLRVMMRLQLPARQDFRYDSRGKVRTDSAIERDWEQACRQRWRTLAAGVKAKLALVDDGVSTIEAEFLAGVLLPDGSTVGERMEPRLREIASSGTMPSLGSTTARVERMEG